MLQKVEALKKVFSSAKNLLNGPSVLNRYIAYVFEMYTYNCNNVRSLERQDKETETGSCVWAFRGVLILSEFRHIKLES